MHPCDVSIIIPAYNEESRLPRTLGSTIEFLKQQTFSSEIIIVTDGSKDGTKEVAESFSDRFANLRVISFPSNRGKGFAVKVGMAQACGRYRMFFDADGAVDISHIISFLAKAAEGNDVIIGSRALEESKKLGRQPFPREQLAVCFGFLQRSVLGLKIVDTQCGFKLFSAEAADKLFPLITLDCAYFDAELIYLATNLGYHVTQLPVVWKHDNETRLPIGLKRTVDIFCKLFHVRFVHAKTFAKQSNFRNPGANEQVGPYATLTSHR
jgi:dolichyl-phosphate beta-glucosyltransferase